MPLCCIGGVCIPMQVLFPIFCVLLRPIYKMLPAPMQAFCDSLHGWIMGFIDMITPSFMKPKKSKKCCEKEGSCVPASSPTPASPVSPGEYIEFDADSHSLEALIEGGAVLAYFTAVWCGPCQQVKPKVKSLAVTAMELSVIAIDVDDNSDLAGEHRVTVMPTFVLFDGGKEVARHTGAGGLQKFDFAPYTSKSKSD